MIRHCTKTDFDLIHEIVNDGAQAYKGVIPEDCWTEPYMSKDELRHEVKDGVAFWGYEDRGDLLAVMGIQPVQDVTLIRHAYVRTSNQRQGIGARMLSHLRAMTGDPVLIGTWADAAWAIRFYEKHGFRLLPLDLKDRILKRYWRIPERQAETSVVLVDGNWWERNAKA